MICPGARVVACGLESRPDLNGSYGMVVSQRQRGRWAVQFGCVGQPLSVAGKNIALAETQALHAHCLIIEPLPLSARREQVRAAVRPCPQVGLPLQTEAAEVHELQCKMGWRDVQGVPGYTEGGVYKDLYIYFDHADTKSPVNALATQAFRMYGLRGAGAMNWTATHGQAVVVRAEPPCNSYEEMLASSNMELPPLTVDEMVGTLCYFRERCARSVARERDMARTLMCGTPGPALAQRPVGKQVRRQGKKCRKPAKKGKKR